MRGPWSFVTQEWGSVVEGFTPSPVIMGPYNPPYYNEDYAAFGLEKVQDMLCWSISGADYEIPERIMRLTDAVAKRYKVKIRHINLKDYEKEVKYFLDLANNSIIDNWGYSPVTDAEAQDMADDLRLVLQERGVLFAENEAGEVIGFAVALPDLNTLLKGGDGRLFPTGIFKLLLGLPRLNQLPHVRAGCYSGIPGQSHRQPALPRPVRIDLLRRYVDGDQLCAGRQLADDQRHQKTQCHPAAPLPCLSRWRSR